MPRHKLPAALHDVIGVALDDLERVRKDKKRYAVEMETWHDPLVTENETTGEETKTGPCYVCFAGAVMAMTLKAPSDRSIDPESFDDHTRNRLYALNDIRNGDPTAAVEAVYADEWCTVPDRIQKRLDRIRDKLDRVKVVPYHKSQRAFIKAMRRIQRILATENL